MTDNDLIKALELYKSACIIRMADMSWSITIGDVLDLINRQKAEIERMEAKQMMAEGYADALEERAKSEAIEEFAERLNEEAEKVCIDREGDFVEADGEIYDTVADWCKKTSDNIVKEMTGEQNDKS